MSWSHLARQLALMKHYFIACAVIFITGFVLGFAFSEQFQTFIDAQLKAMDQLAKSVAGKEHPQMSLFWLILWNNVSKSILIIVMGIFFGFMPIFFLVVNGLLLGYVADMQIKQNSLVYLLKGIIPHGILEIPALIFAAALGVRLGFLVVQSSFRRLTGMRASEGTSLRAYTKALVPAVAALSVMLLIAAVIESTITFGLLKP